MAHLNHLGGLRKEIHHVKQMIDGQERYEPTMVITRPERPGRSFMIPIGAGWKYLDPSNNQEAATIHADAEDFDIVKRRALIRRRLAVSQAETMRATSDIACCVVAETLSRGMGMLLCTALNLAKMMQIFEITPSPQAAAQLLMWIQNELDDLKNYPEHSQDDTIPGSHMAEMVLKDGNRTIFDGEVPMTESDLFVTDEVTRH
ncbi:MAG: hypothetical protein WCV62_05810 [Candidatus Peribacteraceae bacterium]